MKDSRRSDLIKVMEGIENLKLNDGIWHLDNLISKVSYPETGNSSCAEVEEDSFWFNHRNNILTSVALKFVNEKSLVDIGGGNGYVSKSFLKAGFYTSIIEPGLSGVLNAKNNGINLLVHSTFNELNLPENSIPNAGLFDVIEHIDDDLAFLKKLYLNLEKGGKLFVSIPTYNFLWSKADVEAGHFRRYSLKSITEVLEKSGFNIVYSSYFFSFLIPVIFFLRTIPYIITFGKIKSRHAKKWEHNSGKGLISLTVKMLCSIEMSFINNGKKIPVGSSLIVVAEK